MSGIRWERTSFGVGTLIRFKDRKSHSWEYGIYRGISKHEGRNAGFEFSYQPLGPITIWRGAWPEYVEAAVVNYTPKEPE